MRKKIVFFLTVTLFGLMLSGLSACNDYSKPYGTVKARKYDIGLSELCDFELKPYTYDYEVYEKIEKANLQGACNNSAEESIEVYDVRALNKKDITYVCKNPDEVENGVIVSKWVYYYNLFFDAYANGLAPIIKGEIFEKSKNDVYCVEQVMILPELLKNNERYGLGEMIRVDSTREEYAPYGEPCKPESVNLYKTVGILTRQEPLFGYMNELSAAAYVRYSAFIDNLPADKSVEYRLKYSIEGLPTLNIVGYIETEADKLLSNGVSMDIDGADYKTVLNQIQNPKIYSVKGNIFEKIKKEQQAKGYFGKIDIDKSVRYTEGRYSPRLCRQYPDLLNINTASADSWVFYDDNTVLTDGYSLCDASRLKKSKITYVCENPRAVHNGVITTKWQYYFYLYRLEIEKPIDNPAVLWKIVSDDYCLEQLAFYPCLFKNSEIYGLGETFIAEKFDATNAVAPGKVLGGAEVTIPYDLPIAFMLSEEYLAGWITVLKKSPAMAHAYREVAAAAAFRYGLIENRRQEKVITVRTNLHDMKLNIVGYIETEADKLLSNGVSMNIDGADYKTVLNQIQNPTFYSLQGNILK